MNADSWDQHILCMAKLERKLFFSASTASAVPVTKEEFHPLLKYLRWRIKVPVQNSCISVPDPRLR